MFDKNELMWIAIGIDDEIESLKERIKNLHEDIEYWKFAFDINREKYIKDDEESIIERNNELLEVIKLSEKIETLRKII